MKISVLQWNVWYKEKADGILGFLQEVNADIVCLQELTADSFLNPERNLPFEIEQLGYNSHYVVALERTGAEYNRMGNGIFSKFAIAATREIYVQHETADAEDYAHENRIYVEATLSIDDKQLTIGTVHLSYADEFVSTEEKQEETDCLLDAIGGNQTSFILTGDMNSIPDSYTVEKLESRLIHAGPSYAEATWTTKPFAYHGFEANSLDWRLDYVFTTPDVKALSSKILQTDISDHLPILVEIDL